MNTLNCPNCGHHVANIHEVPDDDVLVTESKVSTFSYDEADIVSRFLDECTNAIPSRRVLTSDLLDLYRFWCKRNEYPPISNQLLGRVLKVDCGVEQRRSSGKRYYIGLKPAGLLAFEFYGKIKS